MSQNQKSQKDDNSLKKIYKCIYYYYLFEKKFNSNTNIKNKQKFYLIDKNWLNNFKKECKYNLIKENIIKKENEKLKDLDLFFYLAQKFPLDSNILESKPRAPKKQIIENNEYFFDEYDFLDETTLFKFCAEYNISDVDKKFKLYNVIIINTITYILIYDEYNLEIFKNGKDKEKERFLFSIEKKENLDVIINEFKTFGYDLAFEKFCYDNKNNIENDIWYGDKIGKMRNLCLMNNYKLQRHYSDNNFTKNEKIKNQVINYDKNSNSNFNKFGINLGNDSQPKINNNKIFNENDTKENNIHNQNVINQEKNGLNGSILLLNNNKNHGHKKQMNDFYNLEDNKKKDEVNQEKKSEKMKKIILYLKQTKFYIRIIKIIILLIMKIHN